MECGEFSPLSAGDEEFDDSEELLPRRQFIPDYLTAIA